MANQGVKTTQAPLKSSAPEVIVNGADGTGRLPMASLATQLAATGAIAAEFKNIRDNQTSGTIKTASWAELAAITGTFAKQGAEVPDTDTGTHTDPVVGGTVANSGTFQWSTSPAGWKRIGATGLTGKADKATVDPQLALFSDGISRVNLWNPAAAVDGYIVNTTTGNLQASANYAASDFIPVIAGEQYTLKRANYLMFYNASKVAIGGTGSNPVASVHTLTAPAGAAYMRCSTQKAVVTSAEQMVVHGTTLPADYVPFAKVIDGDKIWPKSVTGEAIAEDAVSPAKTSFLQLGKNLFNKATAEIGKLIGSNGSSASNATYSVSEFIAVTPGQELYGRGAGFSMRATTFYSAAKTVIAGGSDSLSTSIVVPADVYFIRVSIYTSDLNSFQLEVGTAQTGYEPWGYKPTSDVQLSGGSAGSGWKDKKWGALGDSITANGGWTGHVTAALGLVVTNYGIAGTRISGPADSTSAMFSDTRVNAIATDMELVTVMGGTNDWYNNAPLGTATSTDPTTFNGALNLMIEKLITRFPAKHVMLATPPYGEAIPPLSGARAGWPNNFTNTEGLTIRDYAAAIRAACERYNLPCIEITRNIGWNAINKATFLNNDGAYLHPNDAGKARLGEIYIGALKALQPIAA